MTPARRRLLALLAALAALYVLFWFVRPVDAAGLRRTVDELGWIAPAAYVVLSTVLGVALVPGAVLAAAAGLLFGPVLGTACSLAAAVVSSVVALVLSRRVGREGVAEVPSPQLRRIEGLLARRGFAAVVLLRLLPVLPDGPVSHAAGLLRVSVWAIALGTLIGAAPRAVAYVLLGDGLGERDAGTAVTGGVLVVLTGAIGLGLAAWELRRSRRERRARAPTPGRG